MLISEKNAKKYNLLEQSIWESLCTGTNQFYLFSPILYS